MYYYVRWLGAYQKCKYEKKTPILESIRFEMARTTAFACEPIKNKSYVCHAHVGLLVDSKGICRKFKGDVWSYYDDSDRLHTRIPNRHTKKGEHREAWGIPGSFNAIVIDRAWCNLQGKSRAQIRKAQQEFGLPVMYLHDGKLIPVEL